MWQLCRVVVSKIRIINVHEHSHYSRIPSVVGGNYDAGLLNSKNSPYDSIANANGNYENLSQATRSNSAQSTYNEIQLSPLPASSEYASGFSAAELTH